MRVGLFGGSFDPVHRGHIDPVRSAREQLGLDKVIFLPTARPPHKPEREFAPALARLTMVELAVLDEDGMEVSPFELTPGRTAYTIDSLERFGGVYGTDRLTLLLGSDSLPSLDRWRRWEEIVAGYSIGVLLRPGISVEDLRPKLPGEVLRAESAGRIAWVRHAPVDVSSTGLRRALSAGEELPDGVVPELVLKYLRKYPNLYA